MKEKVISYLKKYITVFTVMGFATGVVLYLRNFSEAVTNLEKFTHLADAFTIPAVITLMAGLLVWVYNQGAFDMIAYGGSIAIRNLIPSYKGYNKRDETFYDYKMRQDKKRIKGYSFLFIGGGVYFIPGIVFYILYLFA